MSAATVSAVPKYRRHKGTGQAFIQVKGRRHYLGKWNTPKSKEAYSRSVAELAALPTTPPPLPLAAPAAQLTVVELCAAYLNHASGYYQKSRQPTRTLGGIKAVIRTVEEERTGSMGQWNFYRS